MHAKKGEKVIDKQWGMTPNKHKALMLAKRQLAELVYDAVRLEGINYTLPEIQTLLDGVTVGGHRLADQQVAENQGKAWRKLFEKVKQDNFIFNVQTVCDLHFYAAYEEAITWGSFRSSPVTISGTNYLPPAAEDLLGCFDAMVSNSNNFDDVYDKAIFVFLTMARNQFFFDVNKRMGRFMMNGILLSSGFPVLNIPAKRQLEFNELMIRFYESNEMQDMNKFMRSCLDFNVVTVMLDPKC